MNLSSFALDWQALQPAFNLKSFRPQTVDFFNLQPRAVSAVQQFLQNSHRSLLVLKANDLATSASAVEKWVKSQQAPLTVQGVQYVIEQADSFSFARVTAEPAQSIDDNFAAKHIVATALYCDCNQLFGSIRLHPVSKDIQLNAGLVHQLNGGVLILSVAALFEQFDLWLRLKNLLVTKRFSWYANNPLKSLPCEIPSYPLDLKVILLGDRNELATFAELESELYSLADYSEIDYYINVEQPEQRQQWADYVQTLAHNLQLTITPEGLTKLYQLLVRESEDRTLVSISPVELTALLQATYQQTSSKALSAVDFEQYFQQKSYQQSFLREQTYADILHDQVYVATEGEVVGQINGLSVIEYAGSPLSFGEPSRISCVVQFGDGEIVDVDRKNELAGNIHGKGMMIAEACLANLMNFQSQLPFSASLVFEQSYSDIDGDSASLATFCVLVSALADLALPQAVAVTGAIDQFGLVHAVGGVNDKIEGFFAICQRRGLTGSQGVIVPSAVLGQLSLSDEVVEAVKNNQFTVYAVNDVFEACEILFKRAFFDENEQENPNYTDENIPIAHLISQRIEQKGDFLPKIGLWNLLRIFKRKN
ncbi:Lon-like ATP-dependent protease [Cricetibacter osteomyelitidis]|uniref:endopeptidase La n=1 Tax=Cricetibacter osteomyelitidis TaxID=1521931 RepID=A0A4R2T0I4_9PAST|nr:Lon-like ATP-dependent protease [Cricetibacter osteomyelitidis]